MRLLLFIFLSVLAILPFSGRVDAQSEAIAAVVNDDVISLSDFQDRMHMMLASSGLPPTGEVQARLFPQVMSGLIEEQIKFQEAKALGLKISPQEIAQGFAMIAKQNNLEPQQFAQVLANGQVKKSTMDRQIKSQILWSRVVQKKLRPQISINSQDVAAERKRLEQAVGKTEYLLAEIFLPVSGGEEEPKISELATQLVEEIKGKNAPFFKLAQQFSKAPGAQQGGMRGWIQVGQLPEELDEAVALLGKGEVSAPIRSVQGYHILWLRDSRLITAENLPDEDALTNRLGMERLQRLERRYLRDLKTAAFLDVRLGS